MVSFKKLFLAGSLLFSGAFAAPTTPASESDVLDKRALTTGSDAQNVCEGQQIAISGGSARVVDLSGCSALFFYSGTNLVWAAHVFCDAATYAADVSTAASAAMGAGADSVTIAADSVQTNRDAEGVISGMNSRFRFNNWVRYSGSAGWPETATTISASSGSRTLVTGEAARVCRGE